MFQRSLGLLAVAAALLVLGGCVAKSDYLRKQAEADALSRDVGALTAESQGLRKRISEITAESQGLRERISEITAESQGLRKRISEITAESQGLRKRISEIEEKFSGLQTEKERLTAERNDLEARFNTFKEDTNRTIEEQRNRNSELEGDKQMLDESIALLKKSKEAEVTTVNKTYEKLLAEMEGEIEQGQIAITELQGKLTVDVLDKILFDSGQAEVKPEGLAVLKRVVEILMTVTDRMIRIEGHTDNIPVMRVRERYPTNWELSAARALNVTRYLEKEGIDPSILSAAAFGEYQPVAENDTPEGRAKNRRIAIILLPK
jgi:chemotaxis protein MotB